MQRRPGPQRCPVLYARWAGSDMREIVLEAPWAFLSGPPQPGTFLHVGVPGGGRLRRPISLMSAGAQAGTLTLGVSPRGAGTAALCALKPGDEIDVLGPLGRGFSFGEAKTLYLVGGGVGVAPLRYAAEAARGREVAAFFGFRTAGQAYALQETVEAGAAVVVATQDGSLGVHGLVTAPLEAWIARKRPDLILSCGPAGMMKAVQALALREGIPCQLSLEERMACGVGACLVCNCRVRQDGQELYRRVCADGPVFSAQEVAL